jgi:hypothetical protein
VKADKDPREKRERIGKFQGYFKRGRGRAYPRKEMARWITSWRRRKIVEKIIKSLLILSVG